jgi:hypothetical protein
LQAGDAAAEVTPDRGQGDVDDHGVQGDHEEAEDRGGQRNPGAGRASCAAGALRSGKEERGQGMFSWVGVITGDTSTQPLMRRARECLLIGVLVGTPSPQPATVSSRT